MLYYSYSCNTILVSRKEKSFFFPTLVFVVLKIKREVRLDVFTPVMLCLLTSDSTSKVLSLSQEIQASLMMIIDEFVFFAMAQMFCRDSGLLILSKDPSV